MQSSLPTGPADQNIKDVDLADFAEIANIVGRASPQAGLLGQFQLSIIWDGPDDRLSDQASHYNSHRCGGNGCRSSALCSRRWRPSPRRNSHMGFVMRRSSHWRIARNSFIPTSVVRTDRLALLPQALM
jgi:hypothetical protein